MKIDHFYPYILYGFVFVIYLLFPYYPNGDSRWTIHLSMSLIRHGDANLDEYQDIIQQNHNYATRVIGAHRYYTYPIGTSLLAVPVVLIIDKASSLIHVGDTKNQTEHFDFEKYLQTHIPAGMEVFIASLIAALFILYIFKIGEQYLKPMQAIFLALVTAFATSTWSLASHALWQHGPSMLMLAVALYLILLAKEKSWLIQYVSLPLAFSYVIRPTNSLSIVILSLFVFLKHREYFLKYLGWSLLIAIPFILFNYHIYGTLVSPYYMPNWIFNHPKLWEGLLGHLISPTRGIFIYSPILIFSLVGIYIKWKKGLELLDYCLISIMAAHWILVSSFRQWCGGHGYGPRFLLEMVPYIMYFMIPFIDKYFGAITTKTIIAVRTIFIMLLTVSLFMQWRGATDQRVWDWNNYPYDSDFSQYRLWDWYDPPFLRYERVLADDGFIKISREITEEKPLTINLGVAEGPFPEWNMGIIKWGYGPKTVIIFNAVKNHVACLHLLARNMFRGQIIKVISNSGADFINEVPVSDNLEYNISLPLKKGRNKVEISYSKWNKVKGKEIDSRPLAIMYKEIEILK